MTQVYLSQDWDLSAASELNETVPTVQLTFKAKDYGHEFEKSTVKKGRIDIWVCIGSNCNRVSRNNRKIDFWETISAPIDRITSPGEKMDSTSFAKGWRSSVSMRWCAMILRAIRIAVSCFPFLRFLKDAWENRSARNWIYSPVPVRSRPGALVPARREVSWE
jgi:hypothetical protein